MKRFRYAPSIVVLALVLINFLIFPNVQAETEATKTVRENRYLIFIPGYYGSMLRNEESDSTIFLNLRRALFGSDQLFVGPTNSTSRSLKVTGVLKSVTVVPGLYSIDGYGESFEIVRKHAVKSGIPKKNVLAFAYDWRQDPISILKDFERFLKASINGPKEDAEISIVAHSMGAWLMSYWLRYGSADPIVAVENWEGLKLVRRAALIAAPYRGTLAVFRNSFWGAPGLPSPSLLSAEVISSFPSTYYLMPGATEVYDATRTKQTLVLHDYNLWQRNGWGLLQFPQLFSRFSADELHGFVRFHVENARLFSEKLHASVQSFPKIENKNFVVIQGRGFATNELALVTSEAPLRLAFTSNQIRQFTLDRYETNVDGDETVSVPSGHAPRYFQQLADHAVSGQASTDQTSTDQASTGPKSSPQNGGGFSFEQKIIKKKHLELLKSPSPGFYMDWLAK